MIAKVRDREVSLREFQTDTGGAPAFVRTVAAGATHKLELAPAGEQ